MSFREYAKHGWVLCDIPAARKGPITKGWNTEAGGIRDPRHAATLRGAGLCHRWSGTCAIDIDDYAEARKWLAEFGVDLDGLFTASTAVRIDSGREGRGKLLYRLAEPLASLKRAEYTREKKKFHAIEFRCASADGLSVQDVLPETIHPVTGLPYQWAYGDELIGHWSNLPELPSVLRDLWTAQLAPSVASVTPTGPVAPVGVAFEALAALLGDQDPDTDYDSWLKLGLAIHHETAGTGLDIWDAWSSRGSKYPGRANLETHWRSFRADAKNPVTLGSLLAATVAKPSDFPVVAEVIETQAAQPPEAAMKRAETMRKLVVDRVVYVRTIDKYFDLDRRTIYPSDRAVRNEFSPLIPYLPNEAGKAEKPDPIAWLQNSRERRNSDVVALSMHPGQGPVFEEDGIRYANGYVLPRPVTARRPMPFERECFDFIWSRILDKNFAAWLFKFYAYALKHPGVKIQSAPILVSEERGTGKTALMYEIPRLLFGRVLPMNEAQLREQFNGGLLSAWWVTFAEVYAGNTKMERRYVTDKLKPWITDPEITIRPMRTEAFPIRNRLQFTGSSNHIDALQLEDAQDRRWGVCGLTEKRYTQKEGIDVYQGFLNAPDAAGALKWIFEETSLTGFAPSALPPVTAAKHVMVAAGRGMWEDALEARMQVRQAPFNLDVFTAASAKECVFGGQGPSVMQLGRILKKEPFNCVPVGWNQYHRYIAWRNAAIWDSATEVERTRYAETGQRPARLANEPWIDDSMAPINDPLLE